MDYLLLSVFPLLMAYAAYSDLTTMTIPNRISALLVVVFIVAAVVAGMPAKTLLMHLGAGALMLTITFALFAFGIIGGGDAKLAAATAIWCGFGQLMDYLIVASLAGGVLTLLLLQARRLLLPHFAARIDWVRRLHERGTGIPYGIALGIGGLVVYPHTAIFSLVQN